jgi:flagellar biogenesis protein FliO
MGRRAAAINAEDQAMIAFLIVVIWFFVVLPYIFRRMMSPRAVAIAPPAPMAVTVLMPSTLAP